MNFQRDIHTRLLKVLFLKARDTIYMLNVK